MQNAPKDGSGEQTGAENRPTRPARATGLSTAPRARQARPSRQSRPVRPPRRAALAAALVIAGAIGLSVLLRAREESSSGGASAPGATPVPRPPTEMPVEASATTPPEAATVTETVPAPPAATSTPAVSTPTPRSTVPPTATIVAVDLPRGAPVGAMNTPTPEPVASEPEAVAPREPEAMAPGEPEAAPGEPERVAPSEPERVAPSEPEAGPPTQRRTSQAEPAPPAPAPSQPRQVTRTYRTYTVQRGDSLKQIAARYGVSLSSILAINHISNPDSLRIGQVLVIPPPGS